MPGVCRWLYCGTTTTCLGLPALPPVTPAIVAHLMRSAVMSAAGRRRFSICWLPVLWAVLVDPVAVSAEGLSPAEALRTVPGRARLSRAAFCQRARGPPAGLDELRRPRPDVGHPVPAISDAGRPEAVKVDQYLRTRYDRLPEPPPRGPRGADRITILEDTDGDGHAERAKDFVDGLNLATGLAIGHGGVFVVQAPYLLFYADRNGDDVPDGDPEVLLEGFGLEDAHALANSLQWGPDGWLYGAGEHGDGPYPRHDVSAGHLALSPAGPVRSSCSPKGAATPGAPISIATAI